MSSGEPRGFREDEFGGRPEASGGSSGSRTESAHKGDKEKKEKDKEEFEGKCFECDNEIEANLTFFFLLCIETIKVFDGNCSLRRRLFRAITVPRTCNMEQLLTTALRAFHIAREPNVRVTVN
jgi:hypothetical protein